MRVQVSRVDLDGRKIDFRLVNSDLERFGGVGFAKGGSKSAGGSKSSNKSSFKSSSRDAPRDANTSKDTARTKSKSKKSKTATSNAKSTPLAKQTAAKKAVGKADKGDKVKNSLNQVLQSAVTLKAAAKKKKGRKPFRMN